MYCPFKDCSTLVVNDYGTTSMCCHKCGRMFCARCKVPWHFGISCEEMQRRKKEEEEVIMLMNLAKEKGWKKCPRCGIFIEKIAGCDHMTCRCGANFYYG